MRKTDVLKSCRKSKFLEKNIWKNALALRSKKVQDIFGETRGGSRTAATSNMEHFKRSILNVAAVLDSPLGKVYFEIIVFSCLTSTKPCFRFLFICFAREIKKLLSEFLWKWGWFQGHNERFLKYLGWKLKFQKTETSFCGWKSTDNNDINIFLSLENPCTFLLVKEKTR